MYELGIELMEVLILRLLQGIKRVFGLFCLEGSPVDGVQVSQYLVNTLLRV